MNVNYHLVSTEALVLTKSTLTPVFANLDLMAKIVRTVSRYIADK